MNGRRFSWASRSAVFSVVLMVSMSKMSTPAGLFSSCHWKSSAATAVDTTICATIKLIVVLTPSGAATGGGGEGARGPRLLAWAPGKRFGEEGRRVR